LIGRGIDISKSLRSLGRFFEDADLKAPSYVPVSNITRNLLNERGTDGIWYQGRTIIDSLESMTSAKRGQSDAALRLALWEVKKDRAETVATATVDQGTLQPGPEYHAVCAQGKCIVKSLSQEGQNRTHANAGDFVELRLTGPVADKLCAGEVLCAEEAKMRVVPKFKATLRILDFAKGIMITPGFKAALHVHTAVVECEIQKMMEAVDLQTKEKTANPKVAKPDMFVLCIITVSNPVTLMAFTEASSFGRFILRSEDKTLALGKVIELPKEK